jgi:tryptophanyl-tRNA synthetase
MSKSYGNTVPLFGSKDEIIKAVMGIVTDSSGERPENVYAIHKLLKPEAELYVLYEEKKGKYKDLKEALIEDLESLIGPMRARRDTITDVDVIGVIEEGSDKARAIAARKMLDVRQKVGVAL